MKRIVLTSFSFITLFFCVEANAQFTSGNSFSISAPTEVSINGLVIRPIASTIELVGTEITLSNEAIPGTPRNSINRVYTLNKPISVFGSVGIKYLPSELNGNTESMLELAYFNETDRYVTTAGSVQNAAQDIVMHPFNLATMNDMLKITAVDGNSTLPVVLVSFTAKGFEEQGFLTWSTATEISSDYFEIQRSRNGHEWLPIGNVKSVSDSKKLTEYHFTDLEPLAGNNLYRLKMVDLDGSYAYSRVVNLQFELPEITNVYPNPVLDKLSIERRDWSDIIGVRIYNPAGEILDLPKMTNNTNPLVREYDLGGLPSGIYVIKTIDKKGLVSVSKVAKQ